MTIDVSIDSDAWRFLRYAPSIGGMEKIIVGEFTVQRMDDKLYLSHPSLRKPAPLPEHLLVLLFKRLMREAVGL